MSPTRRATRRALFSAATKIDREAWGLTWNATLETGGGLLGKTVDIELEVQAAKVSRVPLPGGTDRPILPSSVRGATMTGIRRLNHAVLFVTDLDAAVHFYTDVLGFSVVNRDPQFAAAFLKAADSSNHHDLGLFGLGAGAAGPQRGRAGLYHLAWQVDTVEQLAAIRTTLISSGAFTGESSHGATLSVYAVDPAGNELEVMWMLPRSAWGEYEEAAVVKRLDLAAELERWSGVGTADELGTGTPTG